LCQWGIWIHNPFKHNGVKIVLGLLLQHYNTTFPKADSGNLNNLNVRTGMSGSEIRT
jgi:hypothetical protein